jgi:hypothetical protein
MELEGLPGNSGPTLPATTRFRRATEMFGDMTCADKNPDGEMAVKSSASGTNAREC